MDKLQFRKDPKKDKKKTPRPISETKLSKPVETYDPVKASQQVESDIKQEKKDDKRPVGRPKSGRKSYKTVRLQKETVEKINALENAFSLATQDEAVNHAIDLVLRNMSTDERRGYDLWLTMLEKKGQ
ncbi:DUF5388 domain-containing protein [Lactiplantibacillus pentosus]|uniref:DUF5388 domain-containing protein n=1 Tax=Lactiplantibacillus pentosus TaxID=1589 RepID=UPI00207940E0|nr:DUF5388 domain-containing protein [Lactiplantibacillus pentosus]USJ87983.1 DUF5388 domain-containing protein [Lactiplantibacillus pentosus]